MNGTHTRLRRHREQLLCLLQASGRDTAGIPRASCVACAVLGPLAARLPGRKKKKRGAARASQLPPRWLRPGGGARPTKKMEGVGGKEAPRWLRPATLLQQPKAP